MSALLILNTMTVVLFQVQMARRVTDLQTASRSVRYAGLVMLASCTVFALSAAGSSAWEAGAVLLVAAGLQVIGEMKLSSGAWEIGFELAPPDKQGQYQGFFGSGTAVARMLGPLLLTTLIIGWGTPGWLLVGALFLLTGFAMEPVVRWAERTRPDSPLTVSPASVLAPPLTERRGRAWFRCQPMKKTRRAGVTFSGSSRVLRYQPRQVKPTTLYCRFSGMTVCQLPEGVTHTRRPGHGWNRCHCGSCLTK